MNTLIEYHQQNNFTTSHKKADFSLKMSLHIMNLQTMDNV